MDDRIVTWAAELQSLAQAGLYYGKDLFDQERYQRIREIAAEMVAERTELPMEKIRDLFCGDRGYQTPKLSTRAAIFRENRILLVRERTTGKWSMPGGWCDFNLSPADSAVKECREEAGLEVRVTRLAAVLDRARHNRPLYPYNVVICFYLCEALGGQFAPNDETTECGWFPLDALPPLDEPKNTEAQVRLCYEASRAETWETVYD